LFLFSLYFYMIGIAIMISGLYIYFSEKFNRDL